MQATQQLHDAGQSLWIDDITRDMLDSGRLAKMIAELAVTGLTSNPTIFEKAIGKGTDYDAAVEKLVREGNVGRGAVLRAGAAGFVARRRSVSSRVQADRRRRRLCVARGLAAARLRHAGDDRRGKAPFRQGRQAEPLHQDPRHARRPARHRGGDLRRRARQRHAAVLDGRLSRRGGSLHARPGKARRKPASIPTFVPSPRCSSAAGIAPSSSRCRTN